MYKFTIERLNILKEYEIADAEFAKTNDDRLLEIIEDFGYSKNVTADEFDAFKAGNYELITE